MVVLFSAVLMFDTGEYEVSGRPIPVEDWVTLECISQNVEWITM